MRPITCFIIFLSFLQLIEAKRTYEILPEYGRFQFKLFKCEATKEGLRIMAFPNYTCYAKSWSRSISTLNGYMMFRQPISKAFAIADLHYKYGTIYRPVMRLPKFELCSITKLANENIMLKQIVVAIKEAAPSFMHGCPYKMIEAWNISFPSSAMFSLFWQGDYKAVINFTLEENGPIMSTITAIGYASSEIKDSFG